MTLGLCPPHPLCSSLGLHIQQIDVPGTAQHPPSDDPCVLGHPTLKMLGKGCLGPARGQQSPSGTNLGHLWWDSKWVLGWTFPQE